MNCRNCGSNISEKANFCNACGMTAPKGTGNIAGLAGFSPRINDPAFEKYIKNTNRWAWLFSIIIAIAAVVGFFIYGETSSEMENPEALYIGLGIGGMFLVIALLTVLGRKKSTTWDGTVVDKRVQQKRRKKHSGDDDYYWSDYTEFTVYIRSDRGKTETISAEDDDTKYNYYRIGDRVRHHAGINSYEKFDKSGDAIIFCNACASLNDIHEDYCFRCKCPLLK